MSQTLRPNYTDHFEARLFRMAGHPKHGMFYVVPRGVDSRRGSPAYLFPDGMIRRIAIHGDEHAYYRTEAEIDAAYQNYLKLMEGDK